MTFDTGHAAGGAARIRTGGRDPWDEIAITARAWADARSLSWRDAVVLVPFVELLAPARRAFARVGTWMPRIETTRTLAASLGPPASIDAESGFDAALDGLVATQILARERTGQEWRRRDRRGFERAARRVATTARTLQRVAAAVAPRLREDWWQAAREALVGAGHGPAGLEASLARIAVEWAARAPAPDSDRLFNLRPSAWIAVRAGGADALAESLFASSEAPTLVLDTDAVAGSPFEAIARELAGTPPQHAVCDGFEDEASAAAAQVLDHLGRDERPVALVALDRVLVRRVRALLERAGVRIADETGWKMSTTRAGASLMSLLQAARPGATTDEYLDWLKSLPPSATPRLASLAALESACRRERVARRDQVAGLALEGGAARLHADATATLDELAQPKRRSLPEWLDAMHAALARWGALAQLRNDDAGREAIAALGLDPPLAPARRVQLEADVEPLTLAELAGWLDDLLERVAYRPPLAGDAASVSLHAGDADVVVTPLARCMLRPFAAVVVPGADDRTLGARVADDTLLPASVAAALGVPTPASRRDAERLAFAQLLRLPRVTLLRRRGGASDPVAESPWLAQLRLALAALRGDDGAPLDLRPWRDPREARRIAAAPVERTAPTVPPNALPARLSASAFEALRACPYRFFAERVLRLTEADELDDDVEKRDYGTWLHGVLEEFHRDRAMPRDADDDAAHLREAGERTRDRMGLDAAAFLPFAASFAAFVPRYVVWLHERERRGWRWHGGESETRRAPPELEGLELHGVIDRIDRRDGGDEGEGSACDGERAAIELIDYKTGSAEKLKERMREPLEDTQLAFYAALVDDGGDAPVHASYLAIDRTRGLVAIAHPRVVDDARTLVAGVADEMRRIRSGAALRALGEGSACEHCRARGLCRRDHWQRDDGA